MPQRSSDAGVPIATVSRTLDIPVPTIRSWERRYGFPSPPRTWGRHRRYTAQEIEQLRQLRDLITRGHPARDAAARLSAAPARVGDGELLEAMVDGAVHLDSEMIRSALDRSAERLGVEGAIRDVLFPAMHEIGKRWKAGTCNVEQEHLATGSVRAWLARQAAMTPPPFRADPVVLACGPKDLHTIGLEAFAVVLARRGWPCRVLGAITPATALVATVHAVRAVAAVVTAQRSVTRRAAIESLGAVDAVPGVEAFYAGGAFVAPSARGDVPGTYLGEDVVLAAEVLEDVLGGLQRR
jgi:MerR family transcriptional regulator, light-induced transcriptional regulator